MQVEDVDLVEAIQQERSDSAEQRALQEASVGDERQDAVTGA